MSDRSIRGRILRFAPIAGVLVLLGGCASDAPQDTLKPEGQIARDIKNLVNPVFIIAGVVFVLIEVGTVVLVRRFRRRPGDDELPAQTHGNMKAEVAWTLAPAVLLAVVGTFTVITIFKINAYADDATMNVKVIGQQWWWEYQYDTDGDGKPDFRTANDLIIPADTMVKLDVTSRDVIHSFWIPRLNGKRDAVPGRDHDLSVEADKPGTYVGQCTEFCGLSHAYMRQRLIALNKTDFQAWEANQLKDATMPSGGSAEAGAKLFATTCSRCHLARGINDKEYKKAGSGNDLVSGPAPDLTHFATRGAFAGAIFNLWKTDDPNDIVQWGDIGKNLDKQNLEAWLRDPPKRKPMAPAPADSTAIGRGMPNLHLTEEQIDQLVAFLQTLD